MHTNYFLSFMLLSLCCLFQNLVSSQSDQVTQKPQHEYDLTKLFKKLPSNLRMYIISFSVRPLYKETIFEESSIFPDGSTWIPIAQGECIATFVAPVKKFDSFNWLAGKKRKKEFILQESITQKIIKKQFMGER